MEMAAHKQLLSGGGGWCDCPGGTFGVSGNSVKRHDGTGSGEPRASHLQVHMSIFVIWGTPLTASSSQRRDSYRLHQVLDQALNHQYSQGDCQNTWHEAPTQLLISDYESQRWFSNYKCQCFPSFCDSSLFSVQLSPVILPKKQYK